MVIIDSKLIRDQFAGTYLLRDKNEVALIEESTSHAVPRILKRLEELHINKEQVKYIFVTHIHLDHAGGAGTLIKELPNAKLILHPSGSKHMIDPSKLIQGANAVYGEEVVKKDYGEILAIDSERIIECKDAEVFTIGNQNLTTLYTPGHARHHISIYHKESQGIFTGDSFGLSYPDMDVDGKRFYQPTTTPTAFEFDKMLESIDKMMFYKPKKIYFTHYGISNNPAEVKRQIVKRLHDYKEITESINTNSTNQVEELKKSLSDYYINEAKQHGVKLDSSKILELFDIDINLNAMGLIFWINRLKT
jgi:glyoxylase-like metal-dependent hydrolase (beta-lactamase superfamily II)